MERVHIPLEKVAHPSSILILKYKIKKIIRGTLIFTFQIFRFG